MSQSQNPPDLGPKKWFLGARPRTLPAAVVPVLIGVACASTVESPVWWRSVLAGIVSLALQVGVNYANDYSDGVKGTDAVRVGPLRLVGSGAASAQSVKIAAFIAFTIAGVAGLVLALVTTLWLIVVGVVSIIAAWTYTGGPRPYGYAGLGEVFVFIFFGVVATMGTEYVVGEQFSVLGALASVVAGCFACSLLVINNLRDIPGDTDAGKRTLAVKLGDRRTRVLFAALIGVAGIIIVVTSYIAGPFALLGFVGLIAVKPALDAVARGAKGRDLIAVLGVVGKAQMILGITYAAGIAVALSA